MVFIPSPTQKHTDTDVAYLLQEVTVDHSGSFQDKPALKSLLP